jgi:hypothetical protein
MPNHLIANKKCAQKHFKALKRDLIITIKEYKKLTKGPENVSKS